MRESYRSSEAVNFKIIFMNTISVNTIPDRFLLTRPLAKIAQYVIIASYGLVIFQLHGQPVPFPDPKFWITDGPVNAIVATNGRVYIGGDFSYAGPRTGPVALFNQGSGGLLDSPAFINGSVKSVVPDGSGGWFIGGAFTRIGNASITNVAHLLRDLSLDTGWNAVLVGTTVNALALDNGRLYVGGTFTKINGLTLSGGLVGINATNPAVEWNPLLTGTVNALQVTNGLVYAGGNFTSVGSSNLANVAAISTTTALANSFNPSTVDAAVFALFVTPTNVYVGGQFTTIGTKSKNRLAALNTNGVATTWNPNPNGIVRALFITSSNALVGGDFTTIAVTSRQGFAAIGLTGTGTAQPLDLALQAGTTVNFVRSILLSGNSLYVGGQFTNAQAAPHALIAGVDITTGQPIPVPLGSSFNGAAGAVFGANSMAYANGNVLVGGDFKSLGGVARQRAAALSLTNGAALPWAPGFDAPVLTMVYGTNRIYVGGSFTNYNTTNASPSLGHGLGAVDPVTGNPVPFNFLGTNGASPVAINALSLSSDTLYAGGLFATVAGQSRKNLAALDPATGALITGFNAVLAGGTLGVTSLVLAGTNLYVGGDFTTINAVAIPRLAALSPDTGVSIGWVPTPNQAVTTLFATTDTLHVGGNFTSVNPNGGGLITLNHYAAFSLADNSLVPIDASLLSASSVSAVAATPTVIYLGGLYASVGGDFRQNVASLSAIDATAYAWNPSPDVGPSVIALTDDYAFLGGNFRFLGQSPTNQAVGFFAAFQRAPQLQLIKSTPGNIEIDFTTGDRTDAVLQGATTLQSPVWTDLQTFNPGFPQSVILPGTLPQQYFRARAE